MSVWLVLVRIEGGAIAVKKLLVLVPWVVKTLLKQASKGLFIRSGVVPASCSPTIAALFVFRATRKRGVVPAFIRPGPIVFRRLRIRQPRKLLPMQGAVPGRLKTCLAPALPLANSSGILVR